MSYKGELGLLPTYNRRACHSYARKLAYNTTLTIISSLLDAILLSLSRIICESKKFEGSTDCAEPWYNTSYSVENVTPYMIQVCPT